MWDHRLHHWTGAVIPRRLDSIQLPPDESPEALDADSRAVVASVWAERASSELQASLAFNAIASRLVATNAPPDVQYLAARAVSDEVRHASLCLSLAQRYGSTAGWPRAMPADGDDARRLAGSPGSTRIRTNVRASTPNRAGSAASRRRGGLRRPSERQVGYGSEWKSESALGALII